MRFTFIYVIIFTLFTSACSWVKFPKVHKVEVQQGNVVNQEMIDKLKPGMTKSQVKFILGTPLIAGTFNQRRWDYFYSKVSSAGIKTEERVIIYFDSDGNLKNLVGDYLPSSADPEQS